MSTTCVIRRLAFLNLGLIDLLSCSRSLPPSQPRIKELWFVHEPQNLEISFERTWGFPNDCAAV